MCGWVNMCGHGSVEEYWHGRNFHLPDLYFSNYTYNPDYSASGGYLCPSDIRYSQPKRGLTSTGEWKVIVNLPDDQSQGYEKYRQTVRLEQCHYPSSPCSYLATSITSSCIQKHNYISLLAYTAKQGLHMDTFKLPVACSCFIKMKS